MTVRLRVQGRRHSDRQVDDQAVDDELRRHLDLGLELKDVVDASPRARAGVGASELEVEDDDVVEYRDSSGWVGFARVSTLLDRAERSADRSGGRAFELESLLASADRTSRSLTAVATYAIEFPLDVQEALDSLADAALGRAAAIPARAAAVRVVRWLERTVPDDEISDDRYGQAKTHGVYEVGDDLALSAAARLRADDQLPAGRSLVLLHGTFSSTEGAFWSLRDSREWARLQDHYEGRVYSLEHPTLSVSPLANALELARHLPERGVVDLVSHSRGGLVGDLVALASAGALDPENHRGRSRTPSDDEQRLLRDLNETMSARDVEVGRFVRVAAPARGTILASRRVDRVASLLLNVVPAGVGPLRWVLTVMKALVLAFLDQRTDARVIPGVEAMMPSSPLTHLLNISGPVDDQLGVIAGDVDRSRWHRWVLEKAADMFYGQEHDYVVDTLSMYQGAQRGSGGASLHAGPDVNHFTYFGERASRLALTSWLTHDGDGVPEGFDLLDRTPPQLSAASREAQEDGHSAVVLVVPDLFGSTLVGPDGAVAWPDPATIARRGVAHLASDELVPGEVVTRTYGPLVTRLQHGYRVRTVPYDWRGSLDEAADRLLAAVADVDGPAVHVIGHGVGGLVAARALERSDRLGAGPGRLLLLGTPTGGDLSMAAAAAGQGALVEQLTLLDPRTSPADVAAWVRRLPLVIGSMPRQQAILDPTTWEGSALPWPDVATSGIGAALTSDWTAREPVCIVGTGRPTPHTVAPAASGLTLLGTADGDGVVRPDAAAARGAAVVPVDAAHGDLPGAADVLAAIDTILTAGSPPIATSIGSRRGSGESGGLLAADLVPLPSRDTEPLFPTAVDLERAVLGADLGGDRRAVPRIEVEAVHGDLTFAEFPTVVGHYAGSTFEGAERALDRALHGRLSQRDVLGAYPGPVGTADVVLGRAGEATQGGVIIGLGEIGRLTGAVITAGVAEGAVRLAMRRLDEEVDGPRDEGPLSLGIASVLVGTTGTASLSIDLSVTAIIRGVVAANHRLDELGLANGARFDRLQFVERYEDVAIEVVHALQRVTSRSADATLDPDRIVTVPLLGTVEGGRPGQPPADYDHGVWRPIMVETLDDHGAGGDGDEPVGRRSLVFTAAQMAAKSEQVVHASQRAHVDLLIEQVIGTPSPDPRIGQTLYQLLIPNHLKGSTSQADNILLSLDGEASRLPWEMLATAGPNGTLQPIATRSGVIRRLLTPVTTDRPLATSNRALVVGDPPSSHGRLDGAVREARAVARLLDESDHEVRALIRGDGDVDDAGVLTALFDGEYRILHLAAHGVYSDTPEESGVIIGNGPPLSPLTLRQLPTVPPLVFFNCCHLGTIGTSYRELASSVAEELIRQGARGVVAAGWAVDDAAAEIFATTFYTAMLAGAPFGGAVQEARVATYRRHPNVATWGAYQCYGDPGFRLTTRELANGDGTAFVSPVELERHLSDLADASSHVTADIAALTRRVDDAVAATPSSWRTGRVLEAAGRAYANCGRTRDAIACYREALRHVDAESTVLLVEHLINHEGRLAAALADPETEPDREPSSREEEIEELLRHARTRLDGLEQIVGELNAKQHRLAAAHERRAATIHRHDRDLLVQHLDAVCGAYRRSLDLWAPEVDPDSAINWAVFTVLTALAQDRELPEDEVAELRATIRSATEEAERRVRSRPEFWNRVAGPDSRVMLGLLDRDLAAHVTDIAGAYRQAFRTRSTAREQATVVDHLRFLHGVLAAIDQAELGEACEALCAAVTAADASD